MLDLSGKTALITGGARGLGRAIADTMQRAGAQICVLDQPAVLADADLPETWQSIPLDLTDPNAEATLRTALDTLDGLDILVANAGRVPNWRRIAALDMAEWDAVFAINVRGVALTLAAAAPHLVARQGAVVVMASINGYRAHADQALYTASKHAVLGLARAAALDLGRDGVRVNALAPGPVLTDALSDRLDYRALSGGQPASEAIAAMKADTALGRLATEADIANAACFLVSPLAAAITGVCLPIEAGLA